jgi:hypothetical protein
VCWRHFLATDFLVAATGAAVGAVLVGPAAGPPEQPPSADNTNISPTAGASARTGALLLILITIVRIIGFMILDPQRATVDDDRSQLHVRGPARANWGGGRSLLGRTLSGMTLDPPRQRVVPSPGP